MKKFNQLTWCVFFAILTIAFYFGELVLCQRINLVKKEPVMLPNYIIDDIRRREKESSEELFIECPVPVEPDNRTPMVGSDDVPGDRGVAILDYSL